jgi:uncharacterized protein
MGRTFTLRVLPGEFAICRLGANERFPEWAQHGFSSITRTDDEVSVICAAAKIPSGTPSTGGWRLLRFEGTFSFSEAGVLSSVADPLANARISILTVTTYSTDYLLVQDKDLERARSILSLAGHTISA